MIRRDYLLRMIEEFIAMLSRLASLKRGQMWEQASEVIEQEFQRVLGAGADDVLKLSETELLAHLLKGEPTQAVQQKIFIAARLLAEAGEAAAARGCQEESRAFHLKALNLLLDTFPEGDSVDAPAYVPKVEGLLTALAGSPLPPQSQLRLMQHYESLGEFAKAEDMLFALIEPEPLEPGLVQFGLQFYRRLEGKTDAALSAGNLPRPEVEAGAAELRRRIPA
ncbi:MAG TPA: DUF6483 family protein [Verrucomicrobiae bacterium]|nr:DUF6483 family protein [Verrucomicrobiae bacterium]